MRSLDFQHAEIGSISSRKDKSVRFSVETSELKPEEAAALLAYHGQAVRVAVFPINAPVDPLEVQTPRNSKSKSQTLRAVLYRYWEATKSKTPWEEFYSKRLDDLIQAVKNEIP